MGRVTAQRSDTFLTLEHQSYGAVTGHLSVANDIAFNVFVSMNDRSALQASRDFKWSGGDGVSGKKHMVQVGSVLNLGPGAADRLPGNEPGGNCHGPNWIF